jgi:hypothetical protein
MDSDNVATLAAPDVTEEALQVANIAKQTFEFMHSQYDWPYQQKLIQLEGLSDSSKPNYLRLPSNVSELKTFRYKGKELKYLTPEEFLDNSFSLEGAFNSGDQTVEKIVDDSGVGFFIKNNRDPHVYTSFDNEHLIMDAYDKSSETTLQKSNTAAVVFQMPEFKLEDSFVVPVPENMVSLFQSELNAATHLYLRQQASPVDEKRALAGKSKMMKKSDRINQKRRRGFGRK